MNTNKSISVIYEMILAEMGPEDAKKTVSGVVYSAIMELEAADIPVTEENLSRALSFIAEKFVNAAKRYAA